MVTSVTRCMLMPMRYMRSVSRCTIYMHVAHKVRTTLEVVHRLFSSDTCHACLRMTKQELKDGDVLVKEGQPMPAVYL